MITIEWKTINNDILLDYKNGIVKLFNPKLIKKHKHTILNFCFWMTRRENEEHVIKICTELYERQQKLLTASTLSLRKICQLLMLSSDNKMTKRYKTCLKRYGKRLFDPFRRAYTQQFKISINNILQITTSISQLLFFRFWTTNNNTVSDSSGSPSLTVGYDPFCIQHMS